MNRKTAIKIARMAITLNLFGIIDLLSELNLSDKRGTWGYYANRFLPWLKGETEKLPCTVFAKGNSKLPFYSFSALPLVTCPGKGSCAGWCYSLKAWRYPSAFLRQLQNTILIRRRSEALENAWMKIPYGSTVRLYVDGDFDSLSTLIFWFNLMFKRPDLKVYGYSKSWAIFKLYADNGGKFPSNYTLNLSAGSKYDGNVDMIESMKAMPITRGSFMAVEAGKKPELKKVRKIAIAEGIKNLFVCPGKCGSCMTVKGENVHACGALDLMKNTNIVIATH
jgi:hypothetical protein